MLSARIYIESVDERREPLGLTTIRQRFHLFPEVAERTLAWAKVRGADDYSDVLATRDGGDARWEQLEGKPASLGERACLCHDQHTSKDPLSK